MDMGRFEPELQAALEKTGNREQVRRIFERFVAEAPDRARLLAFFGEYPRAVEKLVTIFASSQFLTEILLRDSGYVEMLTDRQRLTLVESAAEMKSQALAAASSGNWLDRLNSLRRFHRKEILRIGASDIFDFWDLATVTEELSNLADAMVGAALGLASDETGIPVKGFAVFALGKLGGRELNYSSDIDLLFVARENASAFLRLGAKVIDALSRITDEGFLYRVDMRLRPWGSSGLMVSSVKLYLDYLAAHARLWEKQALLKLRFVAGDERLGAEFQDLVEPNVFSYDPAELRGEVAEMKRRIEVRLRRKGHERREVKLGEGSIRDVEFVVQYLQLLHGRDRPEVRTRSTLDGLARLHDAGILPSDEYGILREGYVFLRTIEHHLQLMHYQQTHLLPDDQARQDDLARRLGFESGEALMRRYRQHASAIRQVYSRYIEGEELETQHPTALLQFRTIPDYTETFGEEEVRRHSELLARLGGDTVAVVEPRRIGEGKWEVTVVGFDYPGELSVVCGLLSAYEINIDGGLVLTSEGDTPRKIVDVFEVSPVDGEIAEETWSAYQAELNRLLGMLGAGEREKAFGELARKVASAARKASPTGAPLYPVTIDVDNESSSKYTVLRIGAMDTFGFLYEFTSALALQGIYISKVIVRTAGNRVVDVLYVTDSRGRKITDPERIQELKVATLLVKQFTHLLPHAPDPEPALLHFNSFIGRLFSMPNWPREVASLETPEVLKSLAKLLGVSDFLWSDFLQMQYANLFPVVKDVDSLVEGKSKERMRRELENALRDTADADGFRKILNDFKDREILRIGMRQILGNPEDFWRFSRELTDLAEVVVDAVYRKCFALHGAKFPHMAVLALGKFGGVEMGMASDLELMFVYDAEGPEAADFYNRVVACVLGSIRARRKGVFDVDLQLRPYGKVGPLAVSLESFERYFAPDGPAWPYERQALIRMRAVGGDMELGRRLERIRDRFVYTGDPPDFAAIRAMRERQVRHLVAGGAVNVKFSPGGLVDIEYLVQALQMAHGRDIPDLRTTNTREAMAALARHGILSNEDFDMLLAAHTFLTMAIEALRVVRGNAQDLNVPPRESDEFVAFAARMDRKEPLSVWTDLLFHMDAVRRIVERYEAAYRSGQ